MSLIKTEDDSAIHLTTKNEEEAKESLEKYRLVLKLNMIPCEEFLRVLVRCGILSEGTVESIEKLPTREEKNCRILDLVSIYGGTAILKFCDALHLTGHIYLSELLYSSLQNLRTTPDLSPLPLPKLNSKIMSPSDVAQLSAYIEQAVKEGVMKEMWEGGTRDKERSVNNRQKHIDDGWSLTNLLKDRDHELDTTKKQLRQTENAMEDLRGNLDRLSRQLEEARSMQKDDLRTQVTVSQAQERSIQRLTQRLMDTEKTIEDIFLAMTSFVEREDEKETDSRLPKEKLYRETSITFLDKLNDVLQHVMTKYEATMRVRMHYDRLQSERDFMLQYIDISAGAGADDNFREAFSAYIRRNEETTNRLTEKTKRLKTQLLTTKNEQEYTDSQLSAAFQEVESLKVTLKFKDAQMRRLMQDRSQLKDELTTMKRPTLATVVSKLLKSNSDKTYPNPCDKSPNPRTDIKTKEAAVGKPHAMLTSESKEDLRRMLDGYYSPTSAAAAAAAGNNSSDEPGPSRTTKLHIVLPKDDGYQQEDAGDQSNRNFQSLLESKEFRLENGQNRSPLDGVKPASETTGHFIPSGQYVKAGIDATQYSPGEPAQSENETGELRKTARNFAADWTGKARRHNRRLQSNTRKSAISDAGNRVRLYFERHFSQLKTDRSTMGGGDVTGAQRDVRTTHDDVIAAGQNNAAFARSGVGQGDVIGVKSDVESRLPGTNTPEMTLSQAAEPRKLRHSDVINAADGRQPSQDGVVHVTVRQPGTRLDCDILKAVHVTSRPCYDNPQLTTSATYRCRASFGVTGRSRGPVVDSKCLNCSGVEKVVRSRLGLRSAGVICDDQQHKFPSYTRNYSTTYAWQAPEKTDASDLLQITRLDKK